MKNVIKSFCAYRYNLKHFKSPGEFLSLPYDIITPKMQKDFYKKSPYNVIRLILGKEYKSDNSQNNKYTRAKKFLENWIKKGILIKDEKPSIYFYQQEYSHPITNEKKVITGFISLVKLQEYEKRLILPHEDVLSKPLEDRFKLTVATNTQFSAIFGLYHDKEAIIDDLIYNFIKKNKPIINYNETPNLTHKFWKCDTEDIISFIQKIMGNKLIYIADGHHRYQTMLKYREYFRKTYKIPNNVEHPVDYIMMFLVNMDHEGISILPTHRLLYNLKEIKLKSLLKHIKNYFQVDVYSFTKKNESEVKEKWISDLKSYSKNIHAFGVYIKKLNHFFLLKLNNIDAYLKMNNIKASDDWKRLDVNIVHTLIIDHILHITKKDITNQIYIDYTKNLDEALNGVKYGKYQVAIILNPTKVSQVIKIANNNEKMPQKSTYFYPKILTGLVIYKMA